MLVTYPLMDVLRHSSSFSSVGAGLMRQPSADDLDAAQQLVESARGDRQGTHAASAQNDPPYREQDSNTTPSIGRVPENGQSDASTMDESNGLGQVCRYVQAQIFNTRLSFITCCVSTSILCLLTYDSVTVGPRRRRYGEDLLREPPSAMRAVSISSLATLLGPPISKGQARSQQQKRRVGNEATHHLQARIAILNHLLCHIVRPSIHQAPVQEAAAATVPVEQTVAMDVQRTTTASLRRRT